MQLTFEGQITETDFLQISGYCFAMKYPRRLRWTLAGLVKLAALASLWWLIEKGVSIILVWTFILLTGISVASLFFPVLYRLRLREYYRTHKHSFPLMRVILDEDGVHSEGETIIHAGLHSAFAMQHQTLVSEGWMELPDTRLDAANATLRFTRDGACITFSLDEMEEPGLVRCSFDLAWTWKSVQFVVNTRQGLLFCGHGYETKLWLPNRVLVDEIQREQLRLLIERIPLPVRTLTGI